MSSEHNDTLWQDQMKDDNLFQSAINYSKTLIFLTVIVFSPQCNPGLQTDQRQSNGPKLAFKKPAPRQQQTQAKRAKKQRRRAEIKRIASDSKRGHVEMAIGPRRGVVL